MLEEAKGKVAKHISKQVLNEVVEIDVKAKEITEEVKQKVAQLTALEKKSV